MKLSNGEKLILLMLSDIYKKLDIEDSFDPEFIKSAIYTDNLWGLEWKFTGVPFERSGTPKIVSEVVDILDMWSFIEDSYSRLDASAKKRVEDEASPFGKNPKFSGFDGNNETDYISVARFLIDDLERFEKFKGRDLNSHCPSIEALGRMFLAFEPMRKSLTQELLSSDQIIELLKEKVHPENRGKA